MPFTSRWGHGGPAPGKAPESSECEGWEAAANLPSPLCDRVARSPMDSGGGRMKAAKGEVTCEPVVSHPGPITGDACVRCARNVLLSLLSRCLQVRWGWWGEVWDELCPPPKRYADVLTPGPQNVTLFKNSIFTEAIKLKSSGGPSSNRTGIFTKRRNLDQRQTRTQGEDHVKMKAETAGGFYRPRHAEDHQPPARL